ncbi:MAG: hypothetical protein II940_02030 [Methanosarcinaceae archaeon]|nr:hypothetical protein [Methanosarcinaceae archaeon]
MKTGGLKAKKENGGDKICSRRKSPAYLKEKMNQSAFLILLFQMNLILSILQTILPTNEQTGRIGAVSGMIPAFSGTAETVQYQ